MTTETRTRRAIAAVYELRPGWEIDPGYSDAVRACCSAAPDSSPEETVASIEEAVEDAARDRAWETPR